MRWWAAVSDDAAWMEAVIRAGADRVDELEVYLGRNRGISVDLKGPVTGVAEETRSFGYSIRVIDGGRIGASSSSDPDRWRECLDAACASARLSPPQAWDGLPGPAPLRGEPPSADPGLEVTPEGVADLVGALLEGAARHPEATVAGGGARLSRGIATLANSAGVLYSREFTRAGASLEAIYGESTGYEFDASVRAGEIDPAWVGERAAELAVVSAGGTDIGTGTADIILSPHAAAQFISHVVIPALSGRNVHAGRSALAGKIGEQCMDRSLSLTDDPFAPGPGSTAWDAEGVPTAPLPLVDQGFLRCFAYDLKTAYRYGEESTASAVRSGSGGSPAIGVHNLVVDGPPGVVDDDPAVYIHDVVGAHTANPLTGDFSVECANPLRVACGSVEEPVRGAMLAGNIFSMLSDIAVLGSESRVVGSVILPAIRFNSQRIIGK